MLRKLLHFDLLDFQFFSFLLLDENNDGFICLNDLFSLFKFKGNVLAQKEFTFVKGSMFEVLEGWK